MTATGMKWAWHSRQNPLNARVESMQGGDRVTERRSSSQKEQCESAAWMGAWQVSKVSYCCCCGWCTLWIIYISKWVSCMIPGKVCWLKRWYCAKQKLSCLVSCHQPCYLRSVEAWRWCFSLPHHCFEILVLVKKQIFTYMETRSLTSLGFMFLLTLTSVCICTSAA